MLNFADPLRWRKDDIDILQSVYRVPSPHDTTESLAQRPLYNRHNKFFTAKSLAELIGEVENVDEREKLMAELERVKKVYDGLSETYQKGKAGGVESSSFFK